MARYSGDNFICVSKEERDKCLEIMNGVIVELADLLPEGFSTEQMNCFNYCEMRVQVKRL